MEIGFEKLDLRIYCAERQTLDSRWNTDRFVSFRRQVPYTRLYFPEEGEGEVRWKGQLYRLERGKLLLVPPFVPIHVCCRVRLVKYWTHFNAFIKETGMDIFSLLNDCIELPVEESGRAFITDLFERMRRSYHPVSRTALSPLDKFASNAALTLLLEPFFKYVPTHRKGQEFSRFLDLLLFMYQHLNEPLSLRILGQHAGIHPNYLSALFRRQTGLPPIAYLTRLRIQNAMTEIQNGELRIGEIAERVGISDPSGFSKIFRRIAGVSPMKFKRSLREEGWQ